MGGAAAGSCQSFLSTEIVPDCGFTSCRFWQYRINLIWWPAISYAADMRVTEVVPYEQLTCGHFFWKTAHDHDILVCDFVCLRHTDSSVTALRPPPPVPTKTHELMKHATLLAVLFSTSIATAQQVRMFGELELENGEYTLAIPGVVLLPGTLDLSNDVGEIVEIHGNLVPGTPDTVQVTSAAQSDDKLELDGSSRIGESIELCIESSASPLYYLVASLAQDMIPLDSIPLLSGTLFIELPVVTISGGLLTNSYEHVFPLPNNPALVGIDIWFQTALVNTEFVYINVVETTIRS